ncbi:MAG: hypothetical protein AB7I30_23710 [Isosphaeraceae bacterium]
MIRKPFLNLILGLLVASVVGCGKPSESEEFQSNFQKTIEAAEKGKGLVKSPVKAQGK